MSLALLVAFVAYVAAAFCGFGLWFVDPSAAHAAGFIGLGLAIQLLAGVVPSPRVG